MNKLLIALVLLGLFQVSFNTAAQKLYGDTAVNDTVDGNTTSLEVGCDPNGTPHDILTSEIKAGIELIAAQTSVVTLTINLSNCGTLAGDTPLTLDNTAQTGLTSVTTLNIKLKGTEADGTFATNELVKTGGLAALSGLTTVDVMVTGVFTFTSDTVRDWAIGLLADTAGNKVVFTSASGTAGQLAITHAQAVAFHGATLGNREFHVSYGSCAPSAGLSTAADQAAWTTIVTNCFAPPTWTITQAAGDRKFCVAIDGTNQKLTPAAGGDAYGTLSADNSATVAAGDWAFQVPANTFNAAGAQTIVVTVPFTPNGGSASNLTVNVAITYVECCTATGRKASGTAAECVCDETDTANGNWKAAGDTNDTACTACQNNHYLNLARDACVDSCTAGQKFNETGDLQCDTDCANNASFPKMDKEEEHCITAAAFAAFCTGTGDDAATWDHTLDQCICDGAGRVRLPDNTCFLCSGDADSTAANSDKTNCVCTTNTNYFDKATSMCKAQPTCNQTGAAFDADKGACKCTTANHIIKNDASCEACVTGSTYNANTLACDCDTNGQTWSAVTNTCAAATQPVTCTKAQKEVKTNNVVTSCTDCASGEEQDSTDSTKCAKKASSSSMVLLFNAALVAVLALLI